MQVQNEIQARQIATPANPPAGYTDMYFKTDGKLYGKDSAGVETLLAPIPQTGGIANTAFVVTQTTHTSDQTLTGSYATLSGMTQTIAAGSYFLMFTGWVDGGDDCRWKVAMFNAGTEIGGTDGETMRQGGGVGTVTSINVEGGVSIGYYLTLGSSATIDIRGLNLAGTGTFKKGVFTAINLGIINIGDKIGSSVAANRPLYADASGTLREFTGATIDNTNGLFGIGITPTAYLDLKAGTTTVPSMRIRPGVLLTTPLDGAIEYDSTTAWFTIGSTRYDFLLSGSPSTTLDSLSDVVITSPTVKQTLRYNGTNWVNALLLLDDLSDVVITSPASGQIITYSGGNWINSASSGITGSGTTNFVQKWTASTVSGNSLIYSGTNNVGIGYTAEPPSKFAIKAPTGITQIAFDMVDQGNLVKAETICADTGGSYSLYDEAGTVSVVFDTRTATQKSYLLNGNFGVGTNSPLQKISMKASTAVTSVTFGGYDKNNNLCAIMACDDTGGVMQLTNALGAASVISFDGRTGQNSYIKSGNLGLNTSVFNASAVGVFTVKNGTAPSGAVTDSIQIFAKDSSAGSANSTLALYCEQTTQAIGITTATDKFRIWINGVEYYIILAAV